ncbi:MAG: hypothetical protein MK212_17215 [Saprospiraceae bacterium]|nr:hypothetical protein [Saprospiraceae bacterium]
MVKQLFPLTLFLLIGHCLFAQRNVVESYRALQKYNSTLNAYPLEKKGNEWLSYSSAEYSITPTVDYKNGYIEIQDDGTGGGTVTVQVVLFRTVDGRELVGISESMFDGMFVDSDFEFWKSSSSGWKNVTSEVMPSYNYVDFTYAELGDMDNNYEAQMAYSIKLPQHGTTVELRLIEHPLKVKEQSCKDEPASDCGLNEIMLNQRYKYVELTWDKANTRFKRGKQVK